MENYRYRVAKRKFDRRARTDLQTNTLHRITLWYVSGVRGVTQWTPSRSKGRGDSDAEVGDPTKLRHIYGAMVIPQRILLLLEANKPEQ